MIFIGFILAAKIINTAISDWNSNPTITSLDSIDEVQFPTLTVCDDKANEVHDNWAFIESLFNFLEYHCYSSADSIEYNRYCNVTDNLRKDFHFVIESIVDSFLVPLLENENLNQSIDFLGQFRGSIWNWEGHSKLLRRASDLVSSGNMSYDDLKSLPLKHFGKHLPQKEVSNPT